MRIVAPTKALLVTTLIMLSACKPDDPEANARTQARRVADAYLISISQQQPGKPALVEDEGKTWRVTYQGPVDWAGGDRLVWVDKRTMEVVGSIAQQ